MAPRHTANSKQQFTLVHYSPELKHILNNERITANTYSMPEPRNFRWWATLSKHIKQSRTAKPHESGAPLPSAEQETTNIILSWLSCYDKKPERPTLGTMHSRMSDITNQYETGAWKNVLRICRCRLFKKKPATFIQDPSHFGGVIRYSCVTQSAEFPSMSKKRW